MYIVSHRDNGNRFMRNWSHINIYHIDYISLAYSKLIICSELYRIICVDVLPFCLNVFFCYCSEWPTVLFILFEWASSRNEW